MDNLNKNRKQDNERRENESRELIKYLQNPKLFDHPVKRFKVLETHISWVLLTGHYAYKIKKPMKFDFLDFSTPEKRKFFCKEELRLNKRLSGFLYIGMVAITGSRTSPKINGSGQIIEYAIKMEQFEQNKLFSHLAFLGELTRTHIEKLAVKIGHFLAKIESAPANSNYAKTDDILSRMCDNFTDCRGRIQKKPLLKKLDWLEKASLENFERLKKLFQKRKQQGFIKECHGDLHLGNIVLLHNIPTVFDCIEFNPNFRFIDVMNEIAFLTMDLKDKHLSGFANHFLNEVLLITGDYEGLPLLRFYEVYCAMVRAKVTLYLNHTESLSTFKRYLDLAISISKEETQTPILFITVGISGSGKTHISSLLAEILQAIHIRSDTERKRLFPTLAGNALYTRNISGRTYNRLFNLTRFLLQQHYSVIADATFLERTSRNRFRDLAQKLNVPCIFLEFEAEEKILKARVTERLRSQSDSSDATVEIVAKQFIEREYLDNDEMKYCIKINTNKEVSIDAIVRKIKRKLRFDVF